MARLATAASRSPIGRVGSSSDQTASFDFGHFWPEVPETPRIGAYPYVFRLETCQPADHKSPANRLDRGLAHVADLSICHAEGRGFESFSRFASNLLRFGRSALAGEIKPPPHIAPFWALAPKMTAMRGD
jgi:hypothetical protein